ncbi:MAG: urease accessory protein UreH [Acidobacteria bacterium]|nr:MAG: urease accessory protein UreH [Acidobacteriota bacterium]
MNYSLFALGLGFLLGLKHATEADHLVAVTTIVSEQRSVARSALVGAMWGVGHTAALIAAGVVVILLEVTIPERVAAALEFCVALLIVFLGTRVLFLALRKRRHIHVHAHTHGGRTHTHLHFHEHTDAHAATDSRAPSHERHGGLVGWRPVVVGVVHGLAGSAALTLLVLTEVLKNGSRALGLAYLLIFGVGSIGGMMLMSALISLPFVFTASRFARVDAPVRLLTGLLSVAFGIYYAWETTRGL